MALERLKNSPLSDKFFWASAGKYAAAVVIGLTAASFLLGVPGETAATLGAGAIAFGFPAGYATASRRNPPSETPATPTAAGASPAP